TVVAAAIAPAASPVVAAVVVAVVIVASAAATAAVVVVGVVAVVVAAIASAAAVVVIVVLARRAAVRLIVGQRRVGRRMRAPIRAVFREGLVLQRRTRTTLHREQRCDADAKLQPRGNRSESGHGATPSRPRTPPVGSQGLSSA